MKTEEILARQVCKTQDCINPIKARGLCNACRNKEWYYENPDRARNYMLLRRHGITLDEYQVRLDEQKGVCAICYREETDIGNNSNKARALAVDHNHNTGEIRGLLCASCNIGLGKFGDSEEILARAVNYLRGE